MVAGACECGHPAPVICADCGRPVCDDCSEGAQMPAGVREVCPECWELGGFTGATVAA